MQKLTLCAIVRNEADNIVDCLKSVQGIVDAMVVVDTGSTDDTVALAEAAGAQVVKQPWCDDFSAARNAALQHVSGGFVLVLDADERLGPNAGSILREALQKPSFDCARLPLYNARSTDASLESVVGGMSMGPPLLLERLFRFTPDLAWQGVVHEHVTKWASKGRKIVTMQAPIVHYGGIAEVRERLQKSERNRHLLEQACVTEPENPTYLTYLAEDLFQAKEFDRCVEIVERAWDQIASLHSKGCAAPNATASATLRTYLLLKAGDHEGAIATIEQAQAWSGHHPNLHLLRAIIEERLWERDPDKLRGPSRLRRTVKECQQSLSFAGKSLLAVAMPGATDWAAYTHKGMAQLRMNKPQEALRSFDLALEHKPAHVEAAFGRAEALILCGKADLALPALEPLLHPEVADGWILAAWAGYQFGSIQDVWELTKQARSIARNRAPLAAHRQQILTELEAEGQADHCQ